MSQPSPKTQSLKGDRMPTDVKPFKVDGEEFAELCHQQTATGPLIVDVNMTSFTPGNARRFAAWLLRAADYAAKHNKARRRGVDEMTEEES